MQRNRDSLILLICLVPAVYLIYAFFTWEATGSWPLSVPDITLPAIPVPAFLKPVQQQAPALHHLVDRFTASWYTIVIGTVAGLVFGVVVVGVVADAMKALFRVGGQLRSEPAEPVESEPLRSESA